MFTRDAGSNVTVASRAPEAKRGEGGWGGGGSLGEEANNCQPDTIQRITDFHVLVSLELIPRNATTVATVASNSGIKSIRKVNNISFQVAEQGYGPFTWFKSAYSALLRGVLTSA